MNPNYQLFTDKLYEILQGINDLVSINIADNGQTYNLNYESYENLEDDELFPGSACKNNKQLKNLCDKVLAALNGQGQMPSIYMDCSTSNFLDEDFPHCQLVEGNLVTYEYKTNILLFAFDIVKEKDKRDLLYNGIYSKYSPNEWFYSLKYFNDGHKETKSEIVEYLFEKLMETKNESSSQLKFLEAILNGLENQFVSVYRKTILEVLENCYTEFIKYDKKDKDEENYYINAGGNPRRSIDSFISTYENQENWYLYRKFTSNGKFLNENSDNNNLFEDTNFILETLNINHKVLIKAYPTLINQTAIKNMIKHVINCVSNRITGIQQISEVFNYQESKTAISIKIDNSCNKKEALATLIKVLPDMFEFYNNNINKDTQDYKIEKILESALPKVLLDIKIPNKLEAKDKKNKL